MVKPFALRVEGRGFESGPHRSVQGCSFFPETPRIVDGATEFMLCAILSAGGVPFLLRGTEPYGVKPGAMKSILRLLNPFLNWLAQDISG